MALIVYNKENSRPQQVVYQGKRTINMDSKGTVYLSKTMSIELGILGGGYGRMVYLPYDRQGRVHCMER